MSKKDSKTTETLANPKGKTVEELKDIAQKLQTQMNQEQTLLNQDQVSVQNRQAKVLKLQGGLEVILQLIPKKEVEGMIQAKEKQNHKMEEQAESSS